MMGSVLNLLGRQRRVGIYVLVGADLLGQGWSHEEWPFITDEMQEAGPH